MNRMPRLPLILALLASTSRGLAAQAAGEPAHWRITFTPYVWMSGLEGTIGVGSNISEVDVSFTEGAEDFEFGFAGLLESRRYTWVLRLDFYYVSLSDEEAVSAGRTLTVGQDELMLHPEVGYTLLARPWGGVDGLIGARYRNLGVDLGAEPQEVSADRNWVDGTVGANFRYQAGESGASWPRPTSALGGRISPGSSTGGPATTSAAVVRSSPRGATSMSTTTRTTLSTTYSSAVLPSE